MRDRPIYVAFICWYLVGVNSWWLIHSFEHLRSPAMLKEMATIPLPVHFQMAKYEADLVIPLVCAIFMTEGMNWARVLYITWGLANYTLEAFTVPDKMSVLYAGPISPRLAFFALFALLLLLPGPRGYFLLPRHHS